MIHPLHHRHSGSAEHLIPVMGKEWETALWQCAICEASLKAYWIDALNQFGTVYFTLLTRVPGYSENLSLRASQ